MALHLASHDCKFGILTDAASATICTLHRREGVIRPTLVISDRFYFFSQTTSLLVLIASAILNQDQPELLIEGITNISVSTRRLRSASKSTNSRAPSAASSVAPTSTQIPRIFPRTATGHAKRKAAFGSEFGIGGVRVVGEGVTEDGRHTFVELETGEGPLMLYGEEKEWLAGRELIPTAGNFNSETLLEVRHIFSLL